MKVHTEAEVVQLLLVELAVRGMAAKILEEELQVARRQHAFELDARAGRDIHVPVVLFTVLHVDGGDGAPDGVRPRPRTAKLRAPLQRPRLEGRGLLIEEEAAAAVDTERVAKELVGEPEIDALVTEVHTIAHPIADEELVADVAALVEQASEGGEVAVAVAAEQSDDVVGIDEVLRLGGEVEHREDARLDADLPPSAADALAIEGEGLAEADGADVSHVGLVEVVLIGGGEMGPAWIGDEGPKQLAAGKQADVQILEHLRRLRRRRRRLLVCRVGDPDEQDEGERCRTQGCSSHRVSLLRSSDCVVMALSRRAAAPACVAAQSLPAILSAAASGRRSFYG